MCTRNVSTYDLDTVNEKGWTQSGNCFLFFLRTREIIIFFPYVHCVCQSTVHSRKYTLKFSTRHQSDLVGVFTSFVVA